MLSANPLQIRRQTRSRDLFPHCRNALSLSVAIQFFLGEHRFSCEFFFRPRCSAEHRTARRNHGRKSHQTDGLWDVVVDGFDAPTSKIGLVPEPRPPESFR
jgi:hypothetical protein